MKKLTIALSLSTVFLPELARAERVEWQAGGISIDVKKSQWDVTQDERTFTAVRTDTGTSLVIARAEAKTPKAALEAMIEAFRAEHSPVEVDKIQNNPLGGAELEAFDVMIKGVREGTQYNYFFVAYQLPKGGVFTVKSGGPASETFSYAVPLSYMRGSIEPIGWEPGPAASNNDGPSRPKRPGPYRECQMKGPTLKCDKKPFTGRGVIEKKGKYFACSFKNGHEDKCSWSNKTAIVKDGRYYVECRAFAGDVKWDNARKRRDCKPHKYTGRFVLKR